MDMLGLKLFWGRYHGGCAVRYRNIVSYVYKKHFLQTVYEWSIHERAKRWWKNDVEIAHGYEPSEVEAARRAEEFMENMLGESLNTSEGKQLSEPVAR